MVGRYYDHLLPRLVPRLLDNGGNILMMQVENEYGSYGEDKTYLAWDSSIDGRTFRWLVRSLHLMVHGEQLWKLVPWLKMISLWQGTLVQKQTLTSRKCKSSLMSMTRNGHSCVWNSGMDGLIDGKEPVITREPEELTEAVHEVLEQGSINLYMFHGGTNFGFMNGCSARGTIDLPQVTSYDYDALLNEAGNPTAKYMAVRKWWRLTILSIHLENSSLQREHGSWKHSTGWESFSIWNLG